MNCSEAEYLAPLYWSGELDAKVAADLEQHLAACQECEHEFKTQQNYDALVRATVQRIACDTAALEARVRQRMHPAGASWFAAQRRWWAIGASAAVAATVLIVGTLFLRHTPVPQPVAHGTAPPSPTIYEDAADDHREEVVQRYSREWLQGAELQKFLGSQLGVVDLSALTPRGYVLDRARLCELLNRTYVHLVYQQGNNEISMFVRRRDGEDLTGQPVDHVRGRDVHADTVGQLQVAGFQSPTLTVLYVGSLPREQMVRVASTAAASQMAMVLVASRPWRG